MNDLEHYMTRCSELAKEVSKLKAELNARYAKEIDETWYWQGDGEDHLESTTCPILIEAQGLRDLLKKARKCGYNKGYNAGYMRADNRQLE